MVLTSKVGTEMFGRNAANVRPRAVLRSRAPACFRGGLLLLLPCRLLLFFLLVLLFVRVLLCFFFIGLRLGLWPLLGLGLRLFLWSWRLFLFLLLLLFRFVLVLLGLLSGKNWGTHDG